MAEQEAVGIGRPAAEASGSAGAGALALAVAQAQLAAVRQENSRLRSRVGALEALARGAGADPAAIAAVLEGLQQ